MKHKLQIIIWLLILCPNIVKAQICITQEAEQRARELVSQIGYDKIYLKRGESKRICISLSKEAFAFYDINTHQFIVEPGEFKIQVGPSSAELPLTTTLSL